jgi:hypothetical protein
VKRVAMLAVLGHFLSIGIIILEKQIKLII